jgi:hypothetical protein
MSAVSWGVSTWLTAGTIVIIPASGQVVKQFREKNPRKRKNKKRRAKKRAGAKKRPKDT